MSSKLFLLYLVVSMMFAPLATAQPSDQTKIIESLVDRIKILNPQSYPVVEGLWIINFTSSGSDDLIITPINGTSFGTLPDDVEFVSLIDDSGNLFVPTHTNDYLKFSNFSSSGIISLNLLVHTPGEHHLKFEFGKDVEYAHNNASPKSVIEINDATTGGPVLSNDDYFGRSVANIGDLDRDGVNDIVVGAYYNDAGVSDIGAIHIMRMNIDGSVKSTTEINSLVINGYMGYPVLSPSDYFGSSVANIGDLNNDGVNDIAVGAIGDDASDVGYLGIADSNRGAIYILFMNTNGSVQSTVKIGHQIKGGPALSNNDSFGRSIANIGDINRDGVNDIAVGAGGDDTGGTDRGAVYIITLESNGSVRTVGEGGLGAVKITSGTSGFATLVNYNYFGSSIANIGDINRDGVNDIAVGAGGDGGGGTDRGAVYIITLESNGSVRTVLEGGLGAVKIASGTTNFATLVNYDYFGSSIANIGDINRDGVNDIAVGATGDDAGGSNRGAIYILFMNTSGGVKSTTKIDDATTGGPILSNDDYLGDSVANIGDLNNDGVNDIAVGAIYDDAAGIDSGTGINRGAIHIISLSITVPVGTNSIISTAHLSDTQTNSVGSNLNYFGEQVTNIGDIDRDGIDDIVIGDKGDIYVIKMNSNGMPKSTIKIGDEINGGPNTSFGDDFGYSIANIGDINRDGVNDIAVGATGDDTGGTDRGAVYIITLDTDSTVRTVAEGGLGAVKIASGTTNFATLVNYNYFGYSIANIGDINRDGVNDIAVGLSSTTVYIIRLNSIGTINGYTLITEGSNNIIGSAGFPFSVANIGDINRDGVNDIAVGAIHDDTGGTDRGAVYIITLDTDSTVRTVAEGGLGAVKIASGTTNFATLVNYDYFGYSIANIGDINRDGVNDIAVGAIGDDAGGSNRGAIYLIKLNSDGTVNRTYKIDASTPNGPVLSGLEHSFGSSIASLGDYDRNGIDDIIGGGSGSEYDIMFMNPITVNSPSQVTGVSSTAGNTTVSLSWSAPADNAQAITDYIVQFRTGADAFSTFADGTSTSTSAIVTGLTSNVQYDFKVAAVNSAGIGTYSTPVSSWVPLSPVTGLSSTINNGQVSLSWTAPSDNGGSALTDYIIQYTIPASFVSQFGNHCPYGPEHIICKNMVNPLYSPKGITVDSSGNIWVADTSHHQIQKFNSEGNFLLKIPTDDNTYVYPTSNGRFSSPTGITVDSSGNIWVADTNNHRIQKFNSAGAFLLKIPRTDTTSVSSGEGGFSSPTGITVDSSGNIWVADTNNHRIQKFNSAGVYKSQFGSISASQLTNSDNTKFKNPKGITVDSSGNIFVADTDNHRIQKFNSAGTYLSQFGSFGSGNGTFSTPYGITSDSSGNIWVADTFNSRVQKFNSTGIFQSKFGYAGGNNGNGAFNMPHGITVNSSGNIWVTDIGGSKIQKFTENWTTFADGTSTSTSAIVTGLTSNVQYNFRVAAVNSAGTGIYSSSVAANFPPLATPAQITVRAANVTDSGVLLTWNAPNQGGSPISDYIIYYKLGSSSVQSFANFTDGISNKTSATITGLSNGVAYDFKISAVNSIGKANNSTSISATPIAVSSLVSSPTAIGGESQATISWTATDNTITDYTVEYSTDGTNWDDWDDDISIIKSITVTDLDANTNYFFRITPITNCPQTPSTLTVATTTVGAPNTIQHIYTIPENNSMRLEWKAPDTKGAAITDYLIQYKTGNNAYATFSDGTSSNTFATITGLTNAITYDFKIAAVNSAGTGAYSNSVSAAPLNPTTYNSIQTINSAQTFASGTSFVDNQSFGATQNFAEKQKFGDGTSFSANQQFSGTQNFGANQNFAANTQFSAGQQFLGTQTFGAGAAFSANTKFAEGQSFSGTANFASGTSFGNSIRFAENQVFNHDMDFKVKDAKFSSGTRFDNAESFGKMATFTGVQTFTGVNTFGTDTVFSNNQKFTTSQNFGKNSTFGEGTQFSAGQTLKHDYDLNKSNLKFDTGVTFCNAETFGAGANFTGVQTFLAGNTFGINTVFPQSQIFSNTQTFGADNKFGHSSVFSHAFNFGDTNLDFTSSGIEFDKPQNFGEARIFGNMANFTGVQTFVGNNTFGAGAKFDKSQTFANQQIFGSSTFSDQTNFATGQKFNATTTFGEGFGREEMLNKALNFTGDVSFIPGTFIPPNTFFGGTFDREDMKNKKIKFDDGVLFDSTPRTFPFGTEFASGFSKDEMLGKFMTFEAGTYFGGTVTIPTGQTLHPGVMFANPPVLESGVVINPGLALPANTIFASGVDLPRFSAPSYGLLLNPYECTDTTCIPNSSQYLAPGKLIPANIDPTAITASVTSTNNTVSIPGLGFAMEFAAVTVDGTLAVDIFEPSSIPSSSTATDSSKRQITSGSTIFENVGSVMDVSLVNATNTGSMIITIPYDDTALPAGITEANLSLLHYTEGRWETVPNITIDTANNKISATVTSLSPYGAGGQVGTVSSASTSSGGGNTKTMYTSGNNFEWSLEINGKKYLLDKFTNILPIHRTYTGMPVKVTAAIYDSEGPSDVEMVGLYMCLDKTEIFSNAGCYVEWYSNGNKAVYDPNEMFTVNNIQTKTIDDKLLVTFDVSFDKPVYSSMAIQSWDTDRDFILRYIPDALEVSKSTVIPSDVQSQNTEITPEITPELTPEINPELTPEINPKLNPKIPIQNDYYKKQLEKQAIKDQLEKQLSDAAEKARIESILLKEKRLEHEKKIIENALEISKKRLEKAIADSQERISQMKVGVDNTIYSDTLEAIQIETAEYEQMIIQNTEINRQKALLEIKSKNPDSYQITSDQYTVQNIPFAESEAKQYMMQKIAKDLAIADQNIAIKKQKELEEILTRAKNTISYYEDVLEKTTLDEDTHRKAIEEKRD